MNETIDTTIPTEKIYKDRAFWLGTFLGGPLVAGYLFAENFKALGQSEKVKPTWIITILVTVLIIGGIFLIPDDINIPNQVIPIVYTAIAYGLFNKYLKDKVDEHIKQGGLIYNWGRVILVAIIGLLITIAPVFAVAYTSDTIEASNISTKTYGTTAKHEIDFDNSNITDTEIDEIAEGFRVIGFFDLSVAKYVYAVKNGYTYEISISVIEGIENDPEMLQAFVELRNQLDDYLTNNNVEFKLVVDYLDNVVKVLK
ncbi:hypothetical protein [Crocinitomix catalasitica]|uniref:hypothetical protein n=1 Tax=Crocinitomix catalasitica TaxID=184607 RepID=UPI00047F66C7|nr:hypothetical protein [Crocinitomix catalasitica]